MVEGTRHLSELHKMINDVEAFVNSNVAENLARYESEIKAHQDSLTDLVNKRKDGEQMINKLKEDVACQEIGKRELQDNITLRQIKEKVKTLKETHRKLCEKLRNMNYEEIKKNWDELENEKQVLLRQVSDIFIFYDSFTFVYLN